MGNGCCGCSKKPSSPDAASASNNVGDKELESMLDNIKAEMDAENVDPKEVINRLNSLISRIKENKGLQTVESPTRGFYRMVDQIAVKWEKLAKMGIRREILASFFDKVGVSNYMLVGLCVVGSILSRARKAPRNKKSCSEFIRNLTCLLEILDLQLSNNMSISAFALQDLRDEIMNSISACWKYASLAFGTGLLNTNALKAELKETYLELYMKFQNLKLENGILENAVGIKERVDDVKSLLLLENKDVRGAAVVLHGQGGMGKSTLARCVISSAKPHASHGFTIASVCFDSQRSDLETHKKELQSNILKQLTGNNIKVDDIKTGQSELRKVFSSRHCFVFIDNVVQCGQLSDFFPDHLASDANHSLRILVTSRDLDARAYLPLHHEQVKDYGVDRLDGVSSVAALRKYMDVAESAQEKFSGEFVKIERIAELCYGTPILLSTIGRDLKSRRSRPLYYDDVIRRLEEVDFSKYNKLKLEDFILSVFNLLDERTKAAFLDICKFFYGFKWESVRAIVGDTAMEELSDRLMIRKDENKWVMLHDLLRAMALRLVEKEKNRFRIDLRDHGTGCLELSQLVGRDVILSKIEGLFIINYNLEQPPTIYVEPEVFQRLRLLRVIGVRLEFRNEDAEYIPNKLEYLDVQRSHLGGVSQIFHWLKAEKSSPPLRTLALFECNDEFLGNVEKLVHLECLRIEDCHHLRQLPSGISHLRRLREITLRGCYNLENLPTSLAKLGRLEMLSMRLCKNLVALPDEVGKLPCLKKLDLEHCSGLKTLPSSVAGLGRLAELNMNGCGQLQCLPEDIGELSSLTHLSLDDCYNLENLPTSLAKLGRLEMLSMRLCKNLVALPDEVGKLPCLKKLYLNGCSSLKTLPSSVAGLKALERLDIDRCQKLRRLPDDIGELSSLKELYMNNCWCLETLHSSLAKLTSLEIISMNGWSNMVTVPDFISNFYNLQKLYLEGCYNLKELPACLEGFANMEELCLVDCEALEILPDLRKMHSLKDLDIRNCPSIQNARDFIQNMLEVFRNSEKDPRGFRYDAGILES